MNTSDFKAALGYGIITTAASRFIFSASWKTAVVWGVISAVSGVVLSNAFSKAIEVGRPSQTNPALIEL